MDGFVKKLIEILEEYKAKAKPWDFGGVCLAIEIVNKLAEEYKLSEMPTGWIPCSVRLPNREEYLKDDGRFIVTDGNRVYQDLFDVYDGQFEFSHTMHEDRCVIAWMPFPALPAPDQPKGE